MPLEDKVLPTYAKPASQFPQRAEIFIVNRQSPNVLIKLNGMPQASFCLLHAASDARVAGKAERDHGNLGMYRLRTQQMASAFSTPSIRLTEYARLIH
jgi:hypothetical protein